MSSQADAKHSLSPTVTATSTTPFLDSTPPRSPQFATRNPHSEHDSSTNNNLRLHNASTSPTRNPALLPPPPRLYKRRYLGLLQLSLLNIIVSWCWLTFAPVSLTSSQYFSVSIPSINWLSTGFLFAFTLASPLSIWTLNRHGPRGAILVASFLIVVGSWLRYAGARARQGGAGEPVFGLVVVGQVVIGLAQPFVLSAPTYYSELWFSEKGRITATAVASLANPLGGALGQLINPFWVTKPEDIPSMVLYVAIISTALSLPSLFIPSRPPTPPTSTSFSLPTHPPLTSRALLTLLHNRSFYMLILPFGIYVTSFNATSSLLNPILMPFGFSETDAGIAGAILILVGLLSAAITSPLLDKYPNLRLIFIKTLVPLVAVMYLVLIWVPRTGSLVGVYVIMGIIGAASFSLVPIALEMLVDVTYPDVGAEVSSNIAWTLGQLGGGIWILVMDALGEGGDGSGTRSSGALVWQAVWAVLVVPAPMMLGYWGTGGRKRVEVERGSREREFVEEEENEVGAGR